jgi:general stress protein YciG
VAQDRDHMAAIGRRGGSKVAQDRQHMASIGKKGGESK